MKKQHTILTITGSDGTGGAGIQADIKTITALGGYAVSVITSITMQNTLGIQNIYDIPADIVFSQLTALMDDLEPTVIKIGMIRNHKTLHAIINILQHYRAPIIIYDPIFTSSKGELLMAYDMIDAIKTLLFPRCSMIIIKQTDAEIVLQHHADKKEQLLKDIAQFLNLGCNSVMVYGGSNSDVLAWTTNKEINHHEFTTLPLADTHGLSSNLASAIAFYLCETPHVYDAVCHANSYMQQQLSKFGALKGRSSKLYNCFIKAVADHYIHHNDVQYYANLLEVSSRYLAQVTKRIAQKTPKEIIDEQLLAQSKLLLDTTNKTVQEIAYALGFHTQSHFTKFFKKFEDTTPSNYRTNK